MAGSGRIQFAASDTNEVSLREGVGDLVTEFIVVGSLPEVDEGGVELAQDRREPHLVGGRRAGLAWGDPRLGLQPRRAQGGAILLADLFWPLVGAQERGARFEE